MNPLEKKEKLKEEFAKRKELDREEEIKSVSDFDVQIEEETIKWYEENH